MGIVFSQAVDSLLRDLDFTHHSLQRFLKMGGGTFCELHPPEHKKKGMHE